ncbi:MAG: type I phosphomannose isomerase catalytic subunit, partial [Anaerolineales bacterium]
MNLAPLSLKPTIRNYVWGGRALQSLAGPDTSEDAPIAEIWAIYEQNLVADGLFAGRTLADVLVNYGDEVLGMRGGKGRFPLLIKLLDCARWLSLQVHPDDRLAAELEGPDLVGKTEAWHILEAAPEAEIIAGVKEGTSPDALAEAVRGGEKILDIVEYHRVQCGDTVYMPARTVHALGPGLLVYEVQQTSDITYRVFDWNRPLTNGRELHLDKSLAAIDPALRGQIRRAAEPGETLVTCDYFRLERLAAPQARNTHGESFHALTVIE